MLTAMKLIIHASTDKFPELPWPEGIPLPTSQQVRS